jgi:hypothetical protein
VSYFGLVPAALMGQNVRAIIGWAQAMLAAAEPGFGAAAGNPAVALGLAMGAAAQAGRDKLTLLLPPALEPFGLWVEQLVAESTGKNGTGVVPIAGEPLAEPSTYGTDRLFARLRLHGSFEEEMRDAEVRELRAARAPVVEIDLPEPALVCRLDAANQGIRESAIGCNRHFLRQIRIIVHAHAQDISWSKGLSHGRCLSLLFSHPTQGRTLRRRWQQRQ